MQRLPKSLLKLKRKKLGYWRKSVVSASVSTAKTLHKCSKNACLFVTLVWNWWQLTQSIRNQSIPMRYLRGYKGTWLFYMRCTYCCHHCRHCRYEQRDMMSSSAVAVVIWENGGSSRLDDHNRSSLMCWLYVLVYCTSKKCETKTVWRNCGQSPRK